MGEIGGERERHGDVNGGHGQGGGEVTAEVGHFVLAQPRDAGDIVAEVSVC